MSYLDTQFPSFASVLSSIDNESARLKAETEKVKVQRAQAHEAAAERARETATQLKQALADLPTNPAALGGVLENLDGPKKTQVLAGVQKIRDLLSYRDTLSDVAALHSIGSTASAELQENKLRDASSTYEKAHVLIQKLKNKGESSHELALSTLQEFEQSVTEPLMTAVQNELARELEKAEWPKKAPESLDFFEALGNALRVEDETQAVLESFVEIASPLDLRVKFNFETERETNRADKPEWLLGHFFKQVDGHVHWLTTMVQPVLEERFPERFALIELCSALLPSYYRVLQKYFEQVKYVPDLLNHLMSETIRFDVDLHDRYFYHPATTKEERWSGLATSLLNFHPEWFDLWLESERQAAFAQYREVLAAATAWEIDWDSTDECFTHPTVSAINVTQLFDSVTDIYRDLSNPSFQLRMLSDIQLELISQYCTLLSDRVAVYTAVHSSLGRAVGSVSVEDQKKLQGIAGLYHLGKALGACDYVLNFLQDKSNELLFFDMAERVGEDSVFELSVQELELVKDRAIKELVKCMAQEFQKLTKAYYRQDWKFEADAVLETSSQLSGVISGMKPFVDFVERLAGTADFALIMTKFTDIVSKQMFQHTVQSNTFSASGGLQLLKDIELLWLELRLASGHEATRLQQAALLLNDTSVETPIFDNQERAFILKRAKNF